MWKLGNKIFSMSLYLLKQGETGSLGRRGNLKLFTESSNKARSHQKFDFSLSFILKLSNKILDDWTAQLFLLFSFQLFLCLFRIPLLFFLMIQKKFSWLNSAIWVIEGIGVLISWFQIKFLQAPKLSLRFESSDIPHIQQKARAQIERFAENVNLWNVGNHRMWMLSSLIFTLLPEKFEPIFVFMSKYLMRTSETLNSIHWNWFFSSSALIKCSFSSLCSFLLRANRWS